MKWEMYCRECGELKLFDKYPECECPSCGCPETYVTQATICKCGERVLLTRFTNTCECGKLYNSAGSELAPVNMWEEAF